MHLADFLLLHAETVELSLAGEDGPWYPVTVATLRRLPAAYLAREVLVSRFPGTPAGRLWAGDQCYAWRLVRPDPEPIVLASLSARWRAWLRDPGPVVGDRPVPRRHPARRRPALRAAIVGLAHLLVRG